MLTSFFNPPVRNRAGVCSEQRADFGPVGQVGERRQFVLSGELFGIGGDAVQQQLVIAHDPQPVDGDVFSGAALDVGNRFGRAAGGTATELHDRAYGAQRLVFVAHRGTELHHCLIVVARAVRIEDLLGHWGERFDRGPVVLATARVVTQARENAHHVPVHHPGRAIVPA